MKPDFSGSTHSMFGKLFVFVCIFALIVLAYSPSINGEFQFDDIPNILELPVIKNVNSFASLDWFGSYFSGLRPITALTFAFNYSEDSLSTFPFHVTNIIIHFLVTVLVYIFTKKVLKLAGYRKVSGLAFAITFIFALHPMQSQAVSYIVQRSESLASMFYLISLMALIRFYEKGLTLKGALFCLLGLAAFIAGFGSKPIVVTLPFVLFLFIKYFFPKKVSDEYKLKGEGASVLFFKKAFGSLLVALITLFFIVQQLRIIKSGVTVGFEIEGLSPVKYFFTEIKVLLTYIRLLFFPINQSLEYGYKLSPGFFDSATFFSFLALIFFLLIPLFFALKSRKSLKNEYPERVISFGIVWFFVVLSPTSSIIPIVDVIFEHRIYLASWGVIAAFIVIAYEVVKNTALSETTAKKTAVFIFFIVFLFMASLLYKRNHVWQSQMSLWEDVVEKAPLHARAYSNLGRVLVEKRGCGVAWPVLNRGLHLAKEKKRVVLDVLVKVDILNNISICAMEFGRYDEALSYALDAALVQPGNPSVMNTIGEIFFAKKDYGQASSYFLKAIKIAPSPSRYYNAALALEGNGENYKACYYWGKYLELEAGSVMASEVAEHMKEKGCSFTY